MLNITFHKKVKLFIQYLDYYQNNMENIVKKIETFLSYSDEKLEELHIENQKLKEESQSIAKKRKE
ncbi:hypothetical protein BOVMAS02_12790 [Streptococcus uberis]|nr:hypothetical protein [Streptococcus uberis]